MVRIPEEYQEVEYIESTGTQYIDTGILCNTGIKIVCRMGWVEAENNNAQLFGARSTSRDTRFFITSYRGIDFAYGVDNSINITHVARQVYDLLYDTTAVDDEHVFKYGYNENYGSTSAKTSIDTDLSMYIFGSNRSSYSSSSFLSKAIFESMTITDSDENLLFNGIPCYRKSDNEIGIYDTISKTFYTNSGTGTFLKGHNVYYDDVNLLEQRRKILLNTPHLETVSNNIATFNTDMNVSLKDCKIYFSPIQEGEGDPSPDNVRPISGWDGIDVYIGRNILDGMTLNYGNGNIIYPYGYGSVTVYSKIGSACTNWIDCSQYRGQTLTLNHAPEPGSAGWCFYSATNTSDYVTGFYSKDDSSVVEGGLWTITVPDGDNINYMRFSTHPDYLNDVQILLNMETTTISFPQTIYGGYVDLIKGEIVEEWYSITFDGENIKATNDYSNNDFIRAYWVYFSPAGYNIQKAFCNKLTISYNDSSSVFPFLRLERVGGLYGGLVLGTPEDYPELASGTKTDRINAINNWFKENPTQVVYKLRNNVTYTLTPQTLKALKGTNNIFSNANGNIQVKFWTH